MIALPDLLAVTLVAVMTASAAAKIAVWDQTVDWIAELWPTRGPVTTARLVVAVEFAIVVAIVVAPPIGGATAAVWIAAASLALLRARGRVRECGCFGDRIAISWRWGLRNAACAGLGATLAALPGAPGAGASAEELLVGLPIAVIWIVLRQLLPRTRMA